MVYYRRLIPITENEKNIKIKRKAFLNLFLTLKVAPVILHLFDTRIFHRETSYNFFTCLRS